MEAPQPPHPYGTPFLRVMALLAFALLIALLASLSTYYFLSKNTQVQAPSVVTPTYAPSRGKACPMLAKACPDGSYVSMTGLNCEFTACPTSSDSTANWKTYTDTGGNYSIKYPLTFTLHINESHVSEENKYITKQNHIELNSPTADVVPFITIDYRLTNDSLDQFITHTSQCASVAPAKGRPILVGNISGKAYDNTSCGLAGDTEVYIVNNGIGYSVIFNGVVEQTFEDELLTSFTALK